MYNVLAVFVGGGIGSLARYGISEWVKQFYKTSFPLATFLSNAFSCMILAIAVFLLSEKMHTQPAIRLLLITGFCGGFSTFSSFSFETVELFKNGNSMLAFTNIAISILTCTFLIYFILKHQ